ncbi:IS1380 family transposase [Desulfolutivibrio sulfodismutans]|uniref:IS1380 family transposase n=1 Tax=Desulfolutivibrio sulfodismutans TaxID=63561 RepID=UPI0013D8C545|nr:IS1380 family transposase [Desulfolutivibrio sulfodismutans]QLA13167.1 IS1380 family transposase [Desulfolutivibrio sulfodismutans DSM 3696]
MAIEKAKTFWHIDLTGLSECLFTREVRHMGKLALEITGEPIIGNAGLAAMGELMRSSDIDSICAKRESPNYQVAVKDSLRCLGGLLAIGKVGFDHVRQFKDSEFFTTALGVGRRIPSQATLRQRFEAMSRDRNVHDAMPTCSVRMLRKLDFKPRIVSVPSFVGVRIDTDSTILDNSDTKKEGIAKGYSGVLGYAPVCSFLEGGLIVGVKLCPGSHHPLHEGTLDFHAAVRERVRKLTKAHLLWVDDAAFDDVALMAARLKAGDSFITRHNLRRERPDVLINLAMQEGRAHSPRPGKTVYTGCTRREREEIGAVRLVYEVTERTSKKGQALLLPEYTVFSVWTDLEKVSDADILRLYRDRGTCEQYFAELKSELDLERLPSGKFAVNELYFQLGVLVNNMLRVLGELLLNSGIIGLKKATRRRLRTIMQGMMYLCGRLVRHARRIVLKVASSGGFGEALVGLQRRLAQV